jgi:type III secretory pathway component EscU
MKPARSKQALQSALPIFLAAVPLLTSILLFVLAVIFVELSGGLSVKAQSPTQEVLQAIGDISGALAYLCFSILTPLGFISAISLVVVRFVARRSKD